MCERYVSTLAALVLMMAARASTRSPTNAPREPGPGERISIPGAQAIDHIGFVVPDLDLAVGFFREVFGAALLWQSAPVAGHKVDMVAMFHAEPHATSRLAMMRLGPNLNVELIEYDVAGERRAAPLSSAVGVGHLAIAVDDIKAAGAYLSSKGVRMLEGPRLNHDGPNAGQSSWFFLTPWDMAVELVQRPKTLPYEKDTNARLFLSSRRPTQ